MYALYRPTTDCRCRMFFFSHPVYRIVLRRLKRFSFSTGLHVHRQMIRPMHRDIINMSSPLPQSRNGSTSRGLIVQVYAVSGSRAVLVMPQGVREGRRKYFAYTYNLHTYPILFFPIAWYMRSNHKFYKLYTTTA